MAFQRGPHPGLWSTGALQLLTKEDVEPSPVPPRLPVAATWAAIFGGHHTTQDGNGYGLGALLVSQMRVPRFGVDAVLDVYTFSRWNCGSIAPKASCKGSRHQPATHLTVPKSVDE